MSKEQVALTNLPVNHSTHKKERRARKKVIKVFEALGYVIGSTASDRGVCDYGEDFIVQICHPKYGFVLPYSFFVQSKSGYDAGKIEDKYITCAVKTKHINKWKDDKVPVLLTLRDKASKKTYWLLMQDYIKECKAKLGNKFEAKLNRQKTIKVHVPLSNVLDSDGVKIVTVRVIDRCNSYENRDGHKALEDLYEKKPGGKIIDRDYDTGFFWVKMPGGNDIIRYFGEIFSGLTDIALRYDREVEHVASRFSNTFLPGYFRHVLIPLANNQELIIKTKDQEIKLSSLEEWSNWADRAYDLSRYEELMERAIRAE